MKSETIRSRTIVSETGVYMLELTIALPFFLLLIFVLYDFSQYAIAFSAVRTATAKGVREAVGYERPEWTNIAAIFDDNPDPQRADFSELTTQEFVYGTGDPALYEFAASSFGQEFIYRVEARAIAYGNLILRQNGVRHYPCLDKGRCGVCLSMRGSEDFNYVFLWNNQTKKKTLGLMCIYLAPMSLSNLFGVLPPYIQTSSGAVVPIPHYPASMYEQ